MKSAMNDAKYNICLCYKCKLFIYINTNDLELLNNISDTILDCEEELNIFESFICLTIKSVKYLLISGCKSKFSQKYVVGLSFRCFDYILDIVKKALNKHKCSNYLLEDKFTNTDKEFEFAVKWSDFLFVIPESQFNYLESYEKEIDEIFNKVKLIWEGIGE